MMSIADPLLSTANVLKTEKREKAFSDITDWNYDFQTVNSPFLIFTKLVSEALNSLFVSCLQFEVVKFRIYSIWNLLNNLRIIMSYFDTYAETYAVISILGECPVFVVSSRITMSPYASSVRDFKFVFNYAPIFGPEFVCSVICFSSYDL